MSEKIVASRRRAVQISPDDWDVWNDVMICTDETTIGDIRRWAMRGRQNFGMHLMLDEAKETK